MAPPRVILMTGFNLAHMVLKSHMDAGKPISTRQYGITFSVVVYANQIYSPCSLGLHHGPLLLDSSGCAGFY